MTITDNATTNGTAQQQDSPPAAQAGQPSPAGTDTTDPPASETGDQDDTNAEQHADDDAQDDSSRSNREKRYRLRLREAERQRDELSDTLERTRQSIVDNAVQAAGVDPRLMAAAGHTMDTLVGEDGLINHERLSEAVTDTAREFRISPKGRPPQPNQQQGSASAPPKSETSWSSALKGSSD